MLFIYLTGWERVGKEVMSLYPSENKYKEILHYLLTYTNVQLRLKVQDEVITDKHLKIAQIVYKFFTSRIQNWYRMLKTREVFRQKKKLCRLLQSAYQNCHKELFALRKFKRFATRNLYKKFVIGGTVRCPITLNDPIKNPVYLNGNLYERDAIEEWIKSYSSCPLTRKFSTLDDIVTITGFSRYIQQLKQQIVDERTKV